MSPFPMRKKGKGRIRSKKGESESAAENKAEGGSEAGEATLGKKKAKRGKAKMRGQMRGPNPHGPAKPAKSGDVTPMKTLGY